MHLLKITRPLSMVVALCGSLVILSGCNLFGPPDPTAQQIRAELINEVPDYWHVDSLRIQSMNRDELAGTPHVKGRVQASVTLLHNLYVEAYRKEDILIVSKNTKAGEREKVSGTFEALWEEKGDEKKWTYTFVLAGAPWDNEMRPLDGFNEVVIVKDSENEKKLDEELVRRAEITKKKEKLRAEYEEKRRKEEMELAARQAKEQAEERLKEMQKIVVSNDLYVGELIMRGKVSPFTLRVTDFNPANNGFKGEVNWMDEGALHEIEGKVSSDGLNFKETRVIQPGAKGPECIFNFPYNRSSVSRGDAECNKRQANATLQVN